MSFSRVRKGDRKDSHTTDPLLLNYLLNDSWVELGGNVTPISIRDQMIRGQLVVERALRVGLIDTNADSNGYSVYPLLVIGAGAAGVAAAVHSARLGVTTIIVNNHAEPFIVQRGCQSRYISPTQYDWPASHWRDEIFPLLETDHPLTWSGGPANIMADVLTHSFYQAIHSYRGRLRYYASCTAKFHSSHPSHVTMDLDIGGTKFRWNFGLVISCSGIGLENTSPNSNSHYIGPKYWENDYFALSNAGFPSKIRSRVLISGSGDGALQDFLRIICKLQETYSVLSLTPRQIYDFLYEENDIEWQALERKIYSAEDFFIRDWIACETSDKVAQRKADHTVFAHVDLMHERIIDQLIGEENKPEAVLDESVRNRRRKIFKTLQEKVLKPVHEMPKVVLSFPCHHTTASYGLNRFLTLLIGRFLKSAEGLRYGIEFRINKRVAEVNGAAGHICDAKNHKRCYGYRHMAEMAPSSCTGSTDTHSENETDSIEFDIVILRHGITKNPPLFHRTADRYDLKAKISLAKTKGLRELFFSPTTIIKESNRRQIVPYHPVY